MIKILKICYNFYFVIFVVEFKSKVKPLFDQQLLGSFDMDINTLGFIDKAPVLKLRHVFLHLGPSNVSFFSSLSKK